MSKGPDGAQVNRRTAPVFALYLVVIVAGIAAAVAIGLARGSDDGAAGETVERFARAIQSRDGAAACRELTGPARSALEEQERRPCEEAIVELELSGGEVTHVDVAETSAAVDLSEGDRSYLDDTPSGWRISAAGCKPRPNLPYECELES
ncbi:MAG: hypothetical protein M3340_07490 [Actinomycetota bacterium]|nr:hypothetical protein [Actinomycetota bacterium]